MAEPVRDRVLITLSVVGSVDPAVADETLDELCRELCDAVYAAAEWPLSAVSVSCELGRARTVVSPTQREELA